MVLAAGRNPGLAELECSARHYIAIVVMRLCVRVRSVTGVSA